MWRRRNLTLTVLLPFALFSFSLFFLVFPGGVLLAQTSDPDQEATSIWFEPTSDNDARIHFYFFWSETCPHCLEAHPFIDALPDEYPWLEVHDFEVSGNAGNAQLYGEMAAALGQEARSVPGFIFCGGMTVGYGSAETTGQSLKDELEACYDYVLENFITAPAVVEASATVVSETVAVSGTVAVEVSSRVAVANAAPAASAANAVLPAAIAPQQIAPAVTLPLIGALDSEALSLPALTVVIAGLDAFNPCAFFVLMFLLSLMVYARSKSRMLMIGVTFVFFSGLIYFVFMAAWLNVFLIAGELKAITLIAGMVAVVVALINVKDFFWFKRGVSFSIPERAKPGLYQRTRNLLKASSLPAMMAGTVVLALAANSYELLCTSGFPMVYTRALTLNDLPPVTFYTYLVAYNLIYILPLLLIVLLFTFKFGAHKMTEDQGRVLKLLSGLMMLFLGLLLIFAPEALNNVMTAFILLAATVVITAVIVLVERWLHRGGGTTSMHGRGGAV